MFSKKYFQDRLILFLHIAVVATALLSVVASLLRIDTTKSVTIVRYEVIKGLAGYSRADTLELYSFAIAAILIPAISIFIAAKVYSMQRALSVVVLLLALIVLFFLFVVSGAIYNLQ